MSIQAVAWVLDFSEAEGYSRLVLFSIANHCDKFGENSFPSIRSIGREARCDPSTVQVAIKELAELGELTVISGGSRYGTNLYALPKMPCGNSAQGERGRASREREGKVASCTEEVSSSIGNSTHNRPKDFEPSYPSEPSKPSATETVALVESVSDSQPPTPLRTRPCSKCRAYVPEDNLREHERGCVGKKKNKREAKAFRQAEAILNLKPASEVRPHSEAGAELFLELRTLYKAKTGKKLGRLYGEALTKWQTAYQKHGPELLEAAFMDWREGEGNTPWMREQNQPIWHFLKDVDGLVAEAGASPEEERNAPFEIKDISRILREGEK